MTTASSKQVIQILPLGPVTRADLAAMGESIARLFRCRCEILSAVSLPAHAYRPARTQYDADVLLDFLFDRLAVDVLRVVGVTEADLFAEGRNFVFGYAHMRDRVAVFSTLRLREPYWGRPDDPATYRQRVDKALAHELGHTFHTPHCERTRCVMHQVEFLWQLDALDPSYCGDCGARIHGTAARGAADAEALFDLAGSYMRRRRFVRAAATYAAAVEAAPQSAHYHNDHGVALLALGDRAGAAQAFQRAIQLAPGSPHAYYNLGIVARERGDIAAADHFFREALTRDEDPRAAHRYLGILHQDYFHDPLRAHQHFERYRALGGDDLEILRRLRTLATPAAPEYALEDSLVTESSAPA